MAMSSTLAQCKGARVQRAVTTRQRNATDDAHHKDAGTTTEYPRTLRYPYSAYLDISQ